MDGPIGMCVCVCIVTKHLFPMQFLGTLPLCTEDAFVLLILTYLTIIAGKDVTWCELRFLSFALNILIPFIKTQKKISCEQIRHVPKRYDVI